MLPTTNAKVGYSADDASRLFQQARFDECLTATHDDSRLEARMLRARIFMRLGKHVDLLQSGFYFFVNDLPLEQKPRPLALLGAAMCRSDMTKDGLLVHTAARRYAMQFDDRAALGEACYQEALTHWVLGNYSDAEQLLNEPAVVEFEPARRFELLAGLAGVRGHFTKQIAHLRDAIDLLFREPAYDVWMAAWCVQTLSALARELDSADLACYVEAKAAHVPWVPSVAAQQCQTLRNIAWFYATAGQGPTAYDFFSKSASVAPKPALRALTFLDRAYLAAGLNEAAFSEHCLREAEALLAPIDWDTVIGDERAALLLAAELTAPKNPTRSKFFLDKYAEIKTSAYPLLAFSRPDLRIRALIDYTSGVVERSNGDRSAATQHIESAWRTWRSIGFLWRASLAAIHLGEMEHKDGLLEYAAKTIDANFPHIWFRRLVDRHQERLSDPRLQTLSEREREIFVMILKGKNRAAIAADLNISENTVRNRTVTVLRKSRRQDDARSSS